MPFSRSRSIESMTRSLTDPSSAWWVENAPDCQSMASTSVVLPWSTWATIATLRRSSRMAAGMRKRSFRSGRGPLESTGAAGAGRTRRPCRRAWPGLPSATRASRPAAGRGRPRRRRRTLRSRGSGWSPSLTPRVTISSSRSTVSSIGAARVPQRVGQQLAHQQLGELGQRLEVPGDERLAHPAAGVRDLLHPAVQPPGRDRGRSRGRRARPPAGRRRRRGRRRARARRGGGRRAGRGRLGSVGQRRGQPVAALVDVDVARLDQAVGVEQQPGAVRPPRRWSTRRARRRRPAARPRAGRAARSSRPGARRIGDGCPAVAKDSERSDRVEHGVDAGGELHLVGALREVVEVAQDVLRHRVEHREHPDGGAQLAHRRGRPQPAAHDVADDEGHPAAGERDDVEPVAADPRSRLPGQVAVRGVDAGDPRLHARQQGALQGDRGRPRLVVQADVVQGEGRPGRDLLGEGDVGGGVRRAARGRGSAPPRRAPGRGPAAARTAGSGSATARPRRARSRRSGRRPRRCPPGRPPTRRGAAGLRVGHVDAGDPEQDRAVRRPPRSRGGRGSRPGRRAPRRPGPGTRLRASPRATARRSRVSDRCELASTSSRSLASAATARSVTPSTLPPVTGCRRPGRVCAGSGHPGILSHDVLRREALAHGRGLRCGRPHGRAGVRPSGRGDKLAHQQPPTPAVPPRSGRTLRATVGRR